MRALDLLRGVAVLLVLGRHMPRPPVGVVGRTAALQLVRFGWIGVDLFFVLSGFLVSGLLFREYQRNGNVRIGRFLVRRAFKIYPAFYLLLIASLLVGRSVRAVLCEAIFVQNYVGGAWNHTWSLAVEEHFYLLLALSIYAATRVGRRLDTLVVKVILAGMAAELLLRVFVVSRNPNAWPVFQTHYRLDALGFGVLLAWLQHFRHDAFASFVRRHKWKLLVIGVGALGPALLLDATNRFVLSIGLTLNYLGFGALLILCLHSSFRPPRLARLPATGVETLGRYSYSIYLWHIPLLFWLDRTMAKNTRYELLLASYLLATIFVGILMGRLIESPFLALRDKYFASTTASEVDASPVPLPKSRQVSAEN